MYMKLVKMIMQLSISLIGRLFNASYHSNSNCVSVVEDTAIV